MSDPSNESASANSEPETLEQLTARHKKELKAFEGEKRGAIKNAKSRGKKGKGAVKEAEFKYEGLERDLKERHRLELQQLQSGGDEGESNNIDAKIKEEEPNNNSSPTQAEQQQSKKEEKEELTEEQIQAAKREKALAKKLKKKNAARQQEIDREQRIKEENAKAGPSRRQMEMEALQKLQLYPRELEVEEVEADGNCLYRAVSVQCSRLGVNISSDVPGQEGYGKIRSVCADVLLGENRAEYEPFAEFGEGHGAHDSGDHPATYEQYVNNVRSTSTWGGQLELRALSEALKVPIVVFSAESPPLTMGEEHYPDGEDSEGKDWSKKKAVLLSFHRHYYALGEHYNSVIPK
ncbi:hypothetical protein ACHAWT_010485 [Skeletonema menzelii]|mmetsp:Transcript_21026/g.34468  ORF Transcript_21026/g.34468 Transcript_21026/m.34468 type:complete len:350 (+) Transcript_21026:122-1171(+)